MNKNLTEITMILDRSGSMGQCRESAISGFNNFLSEQREQPGEARMSLILFDDRYETPYLSIPISEATMLDTDSFVPRGLTALLDAIGRTIDELGAKLAALPEEGRPGSVIVAILTDGMENASRLYSLKDVSSKIAHQREKYGWDFLFLGADADAIATATKMNIDTHLSACYVADAVGTSASHRALSRKIQSIRKMKSGKTLNEEEERIRCLPMNDLQAEEDRKERGQ